MCVVIACLAACVLGGCSASSSVVVTSPMPMPIKSGKAYVLAHGGPSVDVDMAFATVLTRRGLEIVNVSAAPAVETTGIYVMYDDNWHWDTVMILKSIRVQFFDAKTGSLLVSGDWTNSFLPGFFSPERAVNDVTEEMFKGLAAGR
jgi:hypothetical protein